MNWYDYGARFYDAVLGRFPSLDPLSDKFYMLSPYNYASNNPVTNIDLWGLQGVNANYVPKVSINNFYKGQKSIQEVRRNVEKYAPISNFSSQNVGSIKDANARSILSMPDPIRVAVETDVVFKGVSAGGGIITAGILAAEVAPLIGKEIIKLGSKVFEAIKNPINISRTIGDFAAQSFDQLNQNGTISLGKYNLTSLTTNAIGAPAPVQGFSSALFPSTTNGFKTDFSSTALITGSIYTLGNVASGQGTGALRDFRGMTNFSTLSTKVGVGTVLNTGFNSGVNYIDNELNK